MISNHELSLPAAMHAAGNYSRPRMILALGAVVLGCAGCYVHGGVRGTVAYQEPTIEVAPVLVDVESAPVEVESYPSYAYGGSSVYLVDGRWYRQSAGHWGVYRDEPRALATVRVSYETKYGRHYRPRSRVVRSRPDRR
jgi:hypothetical protein